VALDDRAQLREAPADHPAPQHLRIELFRRHGGAGHVTEHAVTSSAPRRLGPQVAPSHRTGRAGSRPDFRRRTGAGQHEAAHPFMGRDWRLRGLPLAEGKQAPGPAGGGGRARRRIADAPALPMLRDSGQTSTKLLCAATRGSPEVQAARRYLGAWQRARWTGFQGRRAGGDRCREAPRRQTRGLATRTPPAVVLHELESGAEAEASAETYGVDRMAEPLCLVQLCSRTLEFTRVHVGLGLHHQ